MATIGNLVTFPSGIGIMETAALGLVGPVSVCCDWVGYYAVLSAYPFVAALRLVEVTPSLN